MAISNIDQGRADSAWKQTQSIDDRTGAKYGSLVRGLGPMVHTNGLGATLAFLLAKNKPHHGRLYYILKSWIAERFPALGNNDLAPWLYEQDTMIYRAVTGEVLAYGQWLKRFAEARGWNSIDGDEA
jgi:CRISPR-associated protein Cmr5